MDVICINVVLTILSLHSMLVYNCCVQPVCQGVAISCQCVPGWLTIALRSCCSFSKG